VPRRTLVGVSLLSLSLVPAWLSSTPRSRATLSANAARESRVRSDALRRARVFDGAPFKAATVDFSRDPNAGVIDAALTTCRFLPSEPSGTTPKFDCRLPGGEKIKVKYGWTREIPAEIAGTRLLHGLGFPSDRMSRVARLQCFGCGVSPFHFRIAAGWLRLEEAFDDHLDYDRATTFTNVAVERKLPGDAIETDTEQGWAFFELSSVDPARGGASRAEIDALRLMAVFLSHWDNKPANQRLLCADRRIPCAKPILMLHDLGSDFGPYKADLDGWRSRPIWTDSASCAISMKGLPFDGGTFNDVRVSEGGRRLLAARLAPLTPAQIGALFQTAGFSDVDRWVAAFRDKVSQITVRPPCPIPAASS
jgi:hypothetical protein